MNVGCNKGHDSIAWLQRFDQHRFWNLRRLKFQQQMMGGKNDGDGDSYVGVDVEDTWSHRRVSYELEKSSICAHFNIRFHNFEDPKLFSTLFFSNRGELNGRVFTWRKWSSLLATHKSVCSLSRIPKPPPYLGKIWIRLMVMLEIYGWWVEVPIWW